jgi:hypothetical protein
MTRKGYCWTAAVVACALLSTMSRAPAQPPEEDREFHLKAAFLYNFGLYIDWPKGAGGDQDSFVIGVLGKNSVVPFLQRGTANRNIQNKKIVIRHFPSAENCTACHILFVASEPAENRDESAAARLAAALKKMKGKPVLVVSETDGLARKGAAINFFVEENRVRFEINPEELKARGLQVSAKLLQVGKIIQSAKK